MYLYHYTNKENLQSILDSGVINPSQYYAIHGEGVYFTKLSPKAGRKAIFKNNRGPISTNPALYAKTSHYIRINTDYFPGVKKCSTGTGRYGGRDVHIYKGNFKLGDQGWTHGQVEEVKSPNTLSNYKATRITSKRVKARVISETTGAYSVMYLYHYTSAENLQSILNQRMIRASRDRWYAHFGRGVYFTALSPANGRQAIFQNNRGDSSNQRLYDKTSHYIRVDYVPGAFQICHTNDGRDVYIYQGDFSLNYNFNYGQV
ncbi:hypothetical protein CHUAL_011554 [Chamberlinius hualienensis]